MLSFLHIPWPSGRPARLLVTDRQAAAASGSRCPRSQRHTCKQTRPKVCDTWVKEAARAEARARQQRGVVAAPLALRAFDYLLSTPSCSQVGGRAQDFLGRSMFSCSCCLQAAGADEAGYLNSRSISRACVPHACVRAAGQLMQGRHAARLPVGEVGLT